MPPPPPPASAAKGSNKPALSPPPPPPPAEKLSRDDSGGKSRKGPAAKMKAPLKRAESLSSTGETAEEVSANSIRFHCILQYMLEPLLRKCGADYE